MPDKITGALEVGCTPDMREVIVNHPDLQPDENGVGHIVFSPNQARNLAKLLIKKADDCDAATKKKRKAEGKTDEQIVKAKYPNAYCAPYPESWPLVPELKFCIKYNDWMGLSSWKATKEEAWADARQRIEETESCG